MALEVTGQNIILSTYPFKVEAVSLKDDKGPFKHPYHRLLCPDWVNVLPITVDNQAVLIRQFRVGSMTNVLETPGGVIDPNERDPTMAALREMEEETGYTSQRILSLGAINPNPAIMNNRCHFFVALGCYKNPQRAHFPDEEENITVHETDLAELDTLVRQGQVNHALSALCIMLAGKYVKIGP